jgi:hypothetical protein
MGTAYCIKIVKILHMHVVTGMEPFLHSLVEDHCFTGGNTSPLLPPYTDMTAQTHRMQQYGTKARVYPLYTSAKHTKRCTSQDSYVGSGRFKIV